MGTIDIRVFQDTSEIDKIVFASQRCGYASEIVNYGGFISVEGGEHCTVGDIAIDDIPNLILALQKAKDLGWK